VDFDRLLLGKLEVQEFRIRNTCLVPVAWSLDAAEMTAAAPELTASPVQGTIPVNSEAVVTVTFKSVREQVLSTALYVIYGDNVGGMNTANNKNNKLKVRHLERRFQVDISRGSMMIT